MDKKNYKIYHDASNNFISYVLKIFLEQLNFTDFLISYIFSQTVLSHSHLIQCTSNISEPHKFSSHSFFYKFYFIFRIFFILASTDNFTGKKNAPAVLSKYSIKQYIEKSAEIIAEEKLKELDRKLEAYQNVGAISILGKNTALDTNNSLPLKRKKIDATGMESDKKLSENSLEITKNEPTGDYVSLS